MLTQAEANQVKSSRRALDRLAELHGAVVIRGKRLVQELDLAVALLETELDLGQHVLDRAEALAAQAAFAFLVDLETEDAAPAAAARGHHDRDRRALVGRRRRQVFIGLPSSSRAGNGSESRSSISGRGGFLTISAPRRNATPSTPSRLRPDSSRSSISGTVSSPFAGAHRVEVRAIVQAVLLHRDRIRAAGTGEDLRVQPLQGLGGMHRLVPAEGHRVDAGEMRIELADAPQNFLVREERAVEEAHVVPGLEQRRPDVEYAERLPVIDLRAGRLARKHLVRQPGREDQRAPHGTPPAATAARICVSRPSSASAAASPEAMA